MMYCPIFCRQIVRQAVLLLGVGALLHTLPLTAQTTLQQQGDTASVVVHVPPQLSGAAAGRSLQAVNTNSGTPSGQPTALRGAGSSTEQQRAPYDTFTNAMVDMYAAWYDAYLQNAANASAYPVYPPGHFPGGVGGWPYAGAPPLPLFQTPPAGSPPPYSYGYPVIFNGARLI